MTTDFTGGWEYQTDSAPPLHPAPGFAKGL